MVVSKLYMNGFFVGKDSNPRLETKNHLLEMGKQSMTMS